MASRAPWGSVPALPATAADRLNRHRVLQDLICRVCEDEPGTPIHDNLAKVSNWQPLFGDLSEMKRALAAARDDAQGWLATIVMLASMTPGQMREYVRSDGFEKHMELLKGVDTYRDRLKAVQDCAETGFARLFAATCEAYGTPARPSLAIVEA
jgi:hypothetical protein